MLDDPAAAAPWSYMHVYMTREGEREEHIRKETKKGKQTDRMKINKAKEGKPNVPEEAPCAGGVVGGGGVTCVR